MIGAFLWRQRFQWWIIDVRRKPVAGRLFARPALPAWRMCADDSWNQRNLISPAFRRDESAAEALGRQRAQSDVHAGCGDTLAEGVSQRRRGGGVQPSGSLSHSMCAPAAANDFFYTMFVKEGGGSQQRAHGKEDESETTDCMQPEVVWLQPNIDTKPAQRSSSHDKNVHFRLWLNRRIN